MVKYFVLLLAVSISLVTGDDWFDYGNFYQVYPRSFKDGNGDGVGDLIGLRMKLEYLKDIGFDGIWLSPIFASPMVDFGYDISDFYKIHYEFGTMQNFQQLVKKCKALGLKLILDFVPNHTSDQHEWFKKSVANDPEYADYYVWHPGKLLSDGTRVPPSNWLSSFRFSAWEWSDSRQMYYLHQFSVQQPDLNYRNPLVGAAMKKVLTFWLDQGIDGFRIDAVPFLYEVNTDSDGNYPDEPVSGECTDTEGWCYLKHIYTLNQDETYTLIFDWRRLLDDYQRDNGGEKKIMMTEAYTDLDHIIRFYGTPPSLNGSNIPFNFNLLSNTNALSTATDFNNYIQEWLNAMPANVQANWVLGNHDQKRIAERFGYGRVDLLNILLQTLPGIAITYYGEEIGMKDVWISWDDTVDPQACNTDKNTYLQYTRDSARTPFQWDSGINAGFSLAKHLWLPVSPEYRIRNVLIERLEARSHLKVFKKLLSLRKKENSLRQGSFTPQLIGDYIYTYKREAANSQVFIVILNFGWKPAYVDLKTMYKIGNTVTVVTSSITSSYNDGDTLDSTNIHLDSGIGVLLSVPK